VSKTVLSNHKINTGIILVLLILFISVIYLPKSIWDYEDELRDESRFRMHTTNMAEKMHYLVVQSYTTDTEQLVGIVNGVRDSLLAAALDSNYSYYGPQQIILPGKRIAVDYSDEYLAYYDQLHLELFKKLEPSHHMDAASVSLLLDSIKVLFDGGNYVGPQTMVLDSTSLSFTVSDKYNILYQNIKTYMFNALTNSFTRYPDFSNPLVDAVMDSLAKNPALIGRTDFSNVYDGSVRVDFVIPSNFEDNLEKTRMALKKHLKIDSFDSSKYGDTLYTMALDNFFAQMDTTDEMPSDLMLTYVDTGDGEVNVPVIILTEEMNSALAKRRNTLYTMLTGYAEPNPFIAEQVINRALDSLGSPVVGFDSLRINIDLSDVVFNINVHRNVREYFNKVSLEQAYYKTMVNLTELDWSRSAVEVVEFVANTMMKDTDFKKWQIVEATTDTFYVNVLDNFLRLYDNMNLKLYEKLTGEFTNRNDLAYDVIYEANRLAGIDSLMFSGSQFVEFAADTIEINVPLDYLAEYDTTFIIPRDTVVQIDDNEYTGVWKRFKIGVTQEFDADSLPFLISADNGAIKYDYHGTDSVRALNVLEKGDSARVEKIFYGMDNYVVIFSEDSVMENLYLMVDAFAAMDSIQIDTLSVVSEAFVAGDQEKDLFMSKDSFGGWLDTLVSKKYVKKQLFSHYLLTPEHTKCSVTGLPFRITVRNNVNLSIESPITKPIETRRYLVFSQVDSTHGRIDDGEFSWVK